MLFMQINNLLQNQQALRQKKARFIYRHNSNPSQDEKL